MKAKFMKVYQAVYLASKLKSSFQSNGKDMDFKQDLEIEVDATMGITVSANGDTIIIPWSNVVYVQLEPENKAVQAAKPKPTK